MIQRQNLKDNNISFVLFAKDFFLIVLNETDVLIWKKTTTDLLKSVVAEIGLFTTLIVFRLCKTNLFHLDESIYPRLDLFQSYSGSH